MTKAGRRWACEQYLSSDTVAVDHDVSKRIIEQAEFWLQAFCDEVGKKAKVLALANSHGVPHDPNFVDYSEAFDELKRELLGDR